MIELEICEKAQKMFIFYTQIPFLNNRSDFLQFYPLLTPKRTHR